MAAEIDALEANNTWEFAALRRQKGTWVQMGLQD